VEQQSKRKREEELHHSTFRTEQMDPTSPTNHHHSKRQHDDEDEDSGDNKRACIDTEESDKYTHPDLVVSLVSVLIEISSSLLVSHSLVKAQVPTDPSTTTFAPLVSSEQDDNGPHYDVLQRAVTLTEVCLTIEYEDDELSDNDRVQDAIYSILLTEPKRWDSILPSSQVPPLPIRTCHNVSLTITRLVFAIMRMHS